MNIHLSDKGYFELKTVKIKLIKHWWESSQLQILWVRHFDNTVVKRILKLWDRTMHKFKYRVHLWKQYMAFCIQINSKKHFYKALTSALRFLPFELDLWKIGAYYEIEVAQNMWKARKIFLKALKIISPGQKHIILCQEMLRFEVEFMRKILGRKKIFGGSN